MVTVHSEMPHFAGGPTGLLRARCRNHPSWNEQLRGTGIPSAGFRASLPMMRLGTRAAYRQRDDEPHPAIHDHGRDARAARALRETAMRPILEPTSSA
jgi:hypothetical protein